MSTVLVALALALLVAGCGHTEDEQVLPWVKYRRVTGPGGTGMWAGSRHTEVLVRRWWGWSTVFDGTAAPGKPIVLTPTAVLVGGTGGWKVLHESGATPQLACADRNAVPTVPPNGGFIDCADHLAGPARAIATSLRVRRVDPAGALVAQQEITTREPERVFLQPMVSFYDDQGTPYLVSFRDPWAQTSADGSPQRGSATPESLKNIACELIRVAPGPAGRVSAPPGHTVADCSSAEVWSRALGRTVKKPWGRA